MPLRSRQQSPSRAVMRKQLLISASLCFVAIALAYALYEWALQTPQVTTDDAYVGAIVAQVTPQIDGIIHEVHVHDTEYVKKGQLLITLDQQDAQLDYEEARASYDQASRHVEEQIDTVKAAEANVLLKQNSVEQAELQYRRRAGIKGAAVSQEEVSNAHAVLSAAKYALVIAQKQLAAQRAKVADTKSSNPEIEAAQAALGRAALKLKRTEIRAPLDGLVSQLHAQIGQQITTGASLMTIVPIDQLFVDANFKESQIDKIRPGEAVTLTSDVYGSAKVFHGRVEGIGGGTGAAFAIIPAQNATGNWIKVVQRIPVRIALDPHELKQSPLRVGLSMTATVDLTASSPLLFNKRQREPALRTALTTPY